MRKKIKRSCALLLSIMMAASYTGCSTQKATEEIPTLIEPQNEEVSTVKVERTDIRVYKSEMTRVEPMAEEVHFSMDGTVGKVYVEQGQRVEKGTLLAELSTAEYEEAIPQLESQLEELLEGFAEENEQTEKRGAQIESDIARLKREVRSTGGDARNYKRTELELKQIEQERFEVDKAARLEQQQKQETQIREKLAELEEMKNLSKLYSPVEGIVLNQPLNLIGRRFHEDDVAFMIYDESKMYVAANYYTEARFESMPEHYALINGERVELEYIELSDERLKELSVKSTPGSTASKRVQYRLVPKEGQKIKFGDYAVVFFVTQLKEDVLSLPIDVVTYDRAYHVYKYEDGSRKQVEVILGLKDNCRVEILSGVEEGDVIYAQH
ncbi:MAG: efflux RND transporter periplasmic adaptor subunit [Lachnospiraceae bacterium]|nr:efflux RND transporter periplasmic adaptor subunit [Lachnospiraceae bacterium]